MKNPEEQKKYGGSFMAKDTFGLGKLIPMPPPGPSAVEILLRIQLVFIILLIIICIVGLIFF